MRSFNLLAAAAVALFLLPATADAQIRIGPQLSYGGDTEFGVGGRVVANVESLQHWDFIGTFDVFFPDGDVDYWEANGNLAYNFGLPDAPSLSPYVGVGLSIAHASSGSVSDTDLGINFFAGTQFEGASVTPFAEIRLVAEAAEQVVITGGLLF
jgi:hypothetical protein